MVLHEHLLIRAAFQFKGRYLRSRSPFIAEATFEESDSEERRETTKQEGSKGLGGPAGQARPTAPTIGR